MRGCYHFAGRVRQGIQDGPNTLACLLDYEDGSAPKTARANFLLVNTRSIVPFHSDPVSEKRVAQADSSGKVTLLWEDNSGVWLTEIIADGMSFGDPKIAGGERQPFWHGSSLGLTRNGRSTTAVAVHHVARITLNRDTKTFATEHIRDVPGP